MHALLKTIDCIGYPLFFLCITSIFCAKSKKRKELICLFLLIFISFIWRCVYSISSSRYSCFFLLYAFLVILLCDQKNNFIRKKVIVLGVLFWQTIECFEGYSNLYIHDIKESIENLAQDNKAVLIDSREYERLRYSNSMYCFEYDFENNGLQNILESFRYWNEPLYVVCKTTKSNEIDLPTGYYISSKDIRFSTSKDNKKHINLCQIKKKDSLQNCNTDKDNQIKNGDFEQISSHSEKVQWFEKWIKNGASFYAKETFFIPKHSILLPYWSTNFEKLTYPIVYADPSNPIGGKYSLRFIFQKESRLFVMNMIKKSSGLFSFDIRNNNKKNIITVTMSYYQQDSSWINTKTQICYYIPLHDNTIHHYDIIFRKEDFGGPNALIELSCNNIDCTIDNVAFRNLE